MGQILGNKPYSLTPYSLERLLEISEHGDFGKHIRSVTISTESFVPKLMKKDEFGRQIHLANFPQAWEKRATLSGDSCLEDLLTLHKEKHTMNVVSYWPWEKEPECDLVPYKPFLAEKCKKEFRNCKNRCVEDQESFWRRLRIRENVVAPLPLVETVEETDEERMARREENWRRSRIEAARERQRLAALLEQHFFEEITDTYLGCYQRQIRSWSRGEDVRQLAQVIKNLPNFEELRLFMTIYCQNLNCTHTKRSIGVREEMREKCEAFKTLNLKPSFRSTIVRNGVDHSQRYPINNFRTLRSALTAIQAANKPLLSLAATPATRITQNCPSNGNITSLKTLFTRFARKGLFQHLQKFMWDFGDASPQDFVYVHISPLIDFILEKSPALSALHIRGGNITYTSHTPKTQILKKLKILDIVDIEVDKTTLATFATPSLRKIRIRPGSYGHNGKTLDWVEGLEILANHPFCYLELVRVELYDPENHRAWDPNAPGMTFLKLASTFTKNDVERLAQSVESLFFQVVYDDTPLWEDHHRESLEELRRRVREDHTFLVKNWVFRKGMEVRKVRDLSEFEFAARSGGWYTDDF